MMSDQPTDGPALVAETVGRLRCVQEDFADEPAEVRHQHLREELDRAITRLVPGKRKAFIDEVLQRFPNWEHSNGRGDEAVVSTPVAPDPNELAEQLIEAAKAMPESELHALRNRLAGAGLGSLCHQAEGTPDLVELLRLPSETKLSSKKAMEVLAKLVATNDKIDDMAWKAWRLLDRQSSWRKPGDLRAMLIAYMSDEENASAQDMSTRVEQFRRLTSSLIYELREIEIIAKQQAERLAPEKIEQVAEQSMLETFGAACWRTYKKVASDYDAAAIERDIRHRIAMHIEENLR